MNINIKSIEAFKNINQESIELLKEDTELVKYSLGQPICMSGVIPNRVLIIVEGEARLIHKLNNYTSTLAKVGKGYFIGIASILNAESYDFISASSEIIAMSISDKVILKLYKNEPSFKTWCDQTIQVAEACRVATVLQKDSTRSNTDIKQSVITILKNSLVNTLENNCTLELKKGYVSITGSANIVGKKSGAIINKNETLAVRGPLPARIIQLKEEVYKNLSEPIPIGLSEKDQENQDNIANLNIPKKTDLISTSEELGQYIPGKKFKVIRADGEIRETMACLQMLATELELPYRIDSIEKILRDSIRRGKKPTLQLLGGITSMMGLHTSIAKIDPEKANRLPSPTLISWGENFAIVKETNSNFLELVSPSQGIIRLKPEEFSESFTEGFIELLIVEKHDQTPQSKFGLKWLLPAINRYRGVLLQVLLASFVVQLFGLANPLMIQVIIDKVITQRSLDTLEILGLALVVVTILGGIIGSLRTFLFTETTNRIDTRLASEVIDHLLRLPLNYFDKRPVGELGSRVAELEKIRNFLTGQALTTILDAAFSVIYIIVMVIYSWLLTLLALGVVPIQILLTLIGTPLIRRQIRDIAEENASTQSHLVEVLTGIQTVKAQNVERVSRWKWQDLYSKYISKTFQKTITTTALGQTSQVLQQLSQLLVLWVGATLVLKGELTLGQLIAFRIISGYVTQPLLRLSSIWQNIQELKVSFERLADIVDTPQEANEKDKMNIPLPSINGKVEFEDLSFTFRKGLPKVLKNINLKINPGQFVGVVGQSGSGKSTLMKLLPRLYKPDSGRLLIDDYDVNKVELYSLRRQIGIVPQEPLLFAGNISDNIALTDPEAPSDEILRVAKIADAHDFIMNLKDGYSTDVGERGAGLSGGQKQRIAIARTLLSNPKLLIMDEATSALDYETERKVCDALKDSCKDSTVFFITHRLSTVKNADLIVMLHQGSIAEIGTHNDLMNKQGRYFALYRQQESS